MIEIRDLNTLTLDELTRVASGYTSTQEYDVRYCDTEQLINFELRLTPLAEPYIKKYKFDEGTIRQYEPLLGNELSFGAYDGDDLVGLIIAEERRWNESVWVHEFHVAENYRLQGIGRRLMHRTCHIAKHRGLHIAACETQNKNVPAIFAYRKLGFHVAGVDLSLYATAIRLDGIAVFMKRPLV